MKNLTKVAICGLALLVGNKNLDASHVKAQSQYKLVYFDGPTEARRGRLNILRNKELSSNQLAVFDVVASNPEYKIHGCMLDIKFEPERVKLVPVPGDNTNSSVYGNVSTAGFGGKFGCAIGVMDPDGRCRMASAIQRTKDKDAQSNALPAQGVLLRFALQLCGDIFVRPMRPIVDTHNSGLVTADDQIIDDSIIHTDMGDLIIE